MNLNPGAQADTHLLKLDQGHEMILIVRQGVQRMLKFLSQFCVLYAYSHGVKEYIMKILDKIDPDCEFFNRSRVLAPETQQQQGEFRNKGKSFSHLNIPESEYNRTLIVDDQLAVINDKDHLLLSKKFMKYTDKLIESKKREELNTF